MRLYTAVQEAADRQGKSIYRIEHDLNFSNGTIGKWDESMPRADTLQAVANYLDTTVSFLLNRAAVIEKEV